MTGSTDGVTEVGRTETRILGVGDTRGTTKKKQLYVKEENRGSFRREFLEFLQKDRCKDHRTRTQSMNATLRLRDSRQDSVAMPHH